MNVSVSHVTKYDKRTRSDRPRSNRNLLTNQSQRAKQHFAWQELSSLSSPHVTPLTLCRLHQLIYDISHGRKILTCNVVIYLLLGLTWITVNQQSRDRITRVVFEKLSALYLRNLQGTERIQTEHEDSEFASLILILPIVGAAIIKMSPGSVLVICRKTSPKKTTTMFQQHFLWLHVIIQQVP